MADAEPSTGHPVAAAPLPPGLRESLISGRVHSAYLLSGPGDAPRNTALSFARALACEGAASEAPCGSCSACRRSEPGEPIALDGAGKKGPPMRHVGDHPDLLWIERGASDTRVRIGQVRAVQAAMRLRGTEGSYRVAVIADAEWLNQEAQNALLRLLEEPPPRTSLVLVTQSAAGLLATVRSRCQRVAFPATTGDALEGEEAAEIIDYLNRIATASIPQLLDWAESFRGPRAIAAAGTNELLSVASAWLHREICQAAEAGRTDLEGPLHAFETVQRCRKGLAQRNANPQMVAERALLALRDGALQ
jgi:DNA polymerase-3 subunit delta'